ncbi:uncharacterized protein TRIADDRAFT_61512 [Trichoplax adhaerens]|uniref:Ig-like domain-containing protein n=1 Tax=Trichoplax adhaerens TaxID=10228 RepID=B3SB71_TRIAD|nr:hypothetical protein TRIADDRAFT_61512 [Trichoplax adhaerens]EDV20056.1 hypothetical protein TRIADDRAFT_61512 [Trichoplax adhaerens]|eukprot:XP_002117440.1 hypothetical protein TRIADDRAFT_61512 [Trichoplax adhaerens]
MAPRFIKELPSSMRVVENYHVKLQCEVSGSPKPTLEWYRNHVKIERYWDRYSFEGDYVLVVNKTQVGDTGIYTCMAKNRLGYIFHDFAVNVVGFSSKSDKKVPPSLTKVSYNHYTFKSGQKVRLICPLYGIPTPTVKWTYYNGSRIVNHKDLDNLNSNVYKTRASLVIRSIKPSDSGIYVCNAKNKVGKSSFNFTVRVEVSDGNRPTFIVKPHNVTATVGNTVNLTCKVRPRKECLVKWLKSIDASKVKQEQIGESIFYLPDRPDLYYKLLPRNNSDHLIIRSVRLQDHGKYLCVVTCSGHDKMLSAFVYLTVSSKLVGTESVHQMSSIDWGASGNGQPTRSQLHQTVTNNSTNTSCKGLSCNLPGHVYSHCILGLIIGIVSIVSVMVLVIVTGTWTLIRHRSNKIERDVEKKWVKDVCKSPNNSPADV